MTCRGVRRQLSAYADGELTAAEARQVEQHVAGCERCGRELVALRRLVRLTTSIPGEEVPAGLHARILASLQYAPAGGTPPLPPASGPRLCFFARSGPGRFWPLAAGVAAAVAVGLVLQPRLERSNAPESLWDPPRTARRPSGPSLAAIRPVEPDAAPEGAPDPRGAERAPDSRTTSEPASPSPLRFEEERPVARERHEEPQRMAARPPLALPPALDGEDLPAGEAVRPAARAASGRVLAGPRNASVLPPAAADAGTPRRPALGAKPAATPAEERRPEGARPKMPEPAPASEEPAPALAMPGDPVVNSSGAPQPAPVAPPETGSRVAGMMGMTTLGSPAEGELPVTEDEGLRQLRMFLEERNRSVPQPPIRHPESGPGTRKS